MHPTILTKQLERRFRCVVFSKTREIFSPTLLLRASLQLPKQTRIFIFHLRMQSAFVHYTQVLWVVRAQSGPLGISLRARRKLYILSGPTIWLRYIWGCTTAYWPNMPSEEKRKESFRGQRGRMFYIPVFIVSSIISKQNTLSVISWLRSMYPVIVSWISYKGLYPLSHHRYQKSQVIRWF